MSRLRVWRRLSSAVPPPPPPPPPPPTSVVPLADALPVGEVARRVFTSLREFGFDASNTTILTSTCPFERPGLTESVVDAYGGSQAIGIGGLGGIPFAGRTGVDSAFAMAAPGGRHLIVYGTHIDVDSSGEIGMALASNPMLQAFATMDEAAGVEGLDPELLRDRYDLQHSLLLLETAKVYDTLIAHPEPAAALSYRMFDAVQRYLREVVYGGEPRVTPFASLGGITVSTVNGVRFLPLAFEFLDHKEGQLHDLVEDVFPEVARTHGALLFDLAGALGEEDDEKEERDGREEPR